MPRFHCFEPDLCPDALEVALGEEESHHLMRVLRAKEGDSVGVLNGSGLVLEGSLFFPDHRRAFVRVTDAREFDRPNLSLHLAVGMPKGKAVDTIVRQATELGITGLSFLNAERSEVSAKTLYSKEKLEKWKRVAREACKQSENPFLPEIEIAGNLSEWLAGWNKPGRHWVAHPTRSNVTETLPSLVSGQDSLWMLIGPEGGLTDKELDQARNVGFDPVSLGSTVLRVETACVGITSLARQYSAILS